jgi:hypothetical protein
LDVCLEGTSTVSAKYNRHCMRDVEMCGCGIYTLLQKVGYGPCTLCSDVLECARVGKGMESRRVSYILTYFYESISNRIQLVYVFFQADTLEYSL